MCFFCFSLLGEKQEFFDLCFAADGLSQVVAGHAATLRSQPTRHNLLQRHRWTTGVWKGQARKAVVIFFFALIKE